MRENSGKLARSEWVQKAQGRSSANRLSLDRSTAPFYNPIQARFHADALGFCLREPRSGQLIQAVTDDRTEACVSQRH